MLVTSKELVIHAQKNGYCVPAINTQGGNYDIIRAVCEAAEEMRSPIILACYANNKDYYGYEWFATVAKFFAKKMSVPIAIHLDHGDTFEACMQAIKYGFTSVMLDCSAESIKDNIKHTNEIIRAAHALGISVEAEVGELVRLDDPDSIKKNKNIASVEDIKKFVDGCRPDMLAIGIGNAHGFYKGKPNLRLDILKQAKEITDIPFVLHGSTGIPEDMVKEVIKLGIDKINFGTLVRHKYIEYYKEGLDTLDHQGHSWKVAQYAEGKLRDEVIKDIIRLAGSANQR
jgi:ketose-bisphosphate aldolase